MEQRKAKYREIKLWYRFKPELSVWVTKREGKTFLISLPDETWYDGYCFNSGYFVFIQCRLFAIHIRFTWWSLKL